MDNSTVEQRLERLERGLSRSRLRMLIAFAAGAIVAFGPAVAVANHIFSDVPTGHQFHNDIERVYDARITAGCSATTYCPETNVTRGQMAAFLARTGGRVAYDTNGAVADISTPKVIATVTIRPGNVQGGTAFVKLDASVNAYTSGFNVSGCDPCVVWFWLDQQDSPNQSQTSTMLFESIRADVIEGASGPITYVVPVQTGVNVTFDLYAQRVVGTGTVDAIGSLAATYYPFGALGTDSLTP